MSVPSPRADGGWNLLGNALVLLLLTASAGGLLTLHTDAWWLATPRPSHWWLAGAVALAYAAACAALL